MDVDTKTLGTQQIIWHILCLLQSYPDNIRRYPTRPMILSSISDATYDPKFPKIYPMLSDAIRRWDPQICIRLRDFEGPIRRYPTLSDAPSQNHFDIRRVPPTSLWYPTLSDAPPNITLIIRWHPATPKSIRWYPMCPMDIWSVSNQSRWMIMQTLK